MSTCKGAHCSQGLLPPPTCGGLFFFSCHIIDISHTQFIPPYYTQSLHCMELNDCADNIHLLDVVVVVGRIMARE
jgi:hypothetical protein